MSGSAGFGPEECLRVEVGSRSSLGKRIKYHTQCMVMFWESRRAHTGLEAQKLIGARR